MRLRHSCCKKNVTCSYFRIWLVDIYLFYNLHKQIVCITLYVYIPQHILLLHIPSTHTLTIYVQTHASIICIRINGANPLQISFNFNTPFELWDISRQVKKIFHIRQIIPVLLHSYVAKQQCAKLKSSLITFLGPKKTRLGKDLS